eukprot:gene13600-biopygen13393
MPYLKTRISVSSGIPTPRDRSETMPYLQKSSRKPNGTPPAKISSTAARVTILANVVNGASWSGGKAGGSNGAGGIVLAAKMALAA